VTNDIKPDTSLYTTPADRLAAFAMALREETNERPLQGKSLGKWYEVKAKFRTLSGMAANCVDGVDYRLKPEPRVVWVNLYKRGEAYHYGDEDSARLAAAGRRSDNIGTAVRVELPE